MFRCTLRQSSRLLCKPSLNRRCYHKTNAQFTELGPNGQPLHKAIPIIKGDPHECYILIDPDIGYALQAGSSDGASISARKSDRYSLTYSHSTREFYSETSPEFPRLKLQHELPRQTEEIKSPATLYLYGLMHTIALDGTEDARFAETASTILPDLQGVLDKLKDM